MKLMILEFHNSGITDSHTGARARVKFIYVIYNRDNSKSCCSDSKFSLLCTICAYIFTRRIISGNYCHYLLFCLLRLPNVSQIIEKHRID